MNAAPARGVVVPTLFNITEVKLICLGDSRGPSTPAISTLLLPLSLAATNLTMTINPLSSS